MRVLVEILHPAHVHFFRHSIDAWRARGDQVLVTSRDKDCTLALLNGFGIESQMLSTRVGDSGVSLTVEAVFRTASLMRVAQKFKPDLMVGVMGATLAPVGRILGIPTLVFYDTEAAGISNAVTFRLANRVCVPRSFEGWCPANTVKYAGFKELAYLHPDRFKPNPSVLRSLDLKPGEPYGIVRLVSRGAVHDLFLSRREKDYEWLSPRLQEAAVLALAKHIRILISSEAPLPKKLQKFKQIPETQFHHALAFARFAFSESPTVSCEAAMLGVPSFFVSHLSRGYVNEVAEKYGLIQRFSCENWRAAVDEALRIKDSPQFLKGMRVQRKRLLKNAIDTSRVIIEQGDSLLKGGLGI